MNLIENGRIWTKIRLFRSNSTNIQSNLTIFDINLKLNLNSDRDFEVRFEFGLRFRIVAAILMDFSNKFGSKISIKTQFEYYLDRIFGRPRSNRVSLLWRRFFNMTDLRWQGYLVRWPTDFVRWPILTKLNLSCSIQ